MNVSLQLVELTREQALFEGTHVGRTPIGTSGGTVRHSIELCRSMPRAMWEQHGRPTELVVTL